MLKISKNKKTIALDFDGVLHSYWRGWAGETPEDPPNKGAQQFVKDIVDLGYEVIIYSTRASEPIKQWLKDHNFPTIEVCKDKPKAKLYVDDRGFRFEGDFGKVITFIKKDTSPWHDLGSDQKD